MIFFKVATHLFDIRERMYHKGELTKDFIEKIGKNCD